MTIPIFAPNNRTMWQRIQTLYLAVSTVLLFILFFSDACTMTAPDGMQYVTYLQLQKPYFGILLGILRIPGGENHELSPHHRPQRDSG